MKNWLKKLSYKETSDAFQDVIDVDFNPDCVQIVLGDCYRNGLVRGIGIGLGAASVIFGGISIALNIHELGRCKDELD